MHDGNFGQCPSLLAEGECLYCNWFGAKENPNSLRILGTPIKRGCRSALQLDIFLMHDSEQGRPSLVCSNSPPSSSLSFTIFQQSSNRVSPSVELKIHHQIASDESKFDGTCSPCRSRASPADRQACPQLTRRQCSPCHFLSLSDKAESSIR